MEHGISCGISSLSNPSLQRGRIWISLALGPNTTTLVSIGRPSLHIPNPFLWRWHRTREMEGRYQHMLSSHPRQSYTWPIQHNASILPLSTDNFTM